MSPQARKIQNFRDKLRFPKSIKALQRYLGFVNYYRNFISRMAEKLLPFYKLLKTEVPINITSKLKETFDSVNKALSDVCELALKQPIPGKQLVLMMDASFRSAGYALMIEDNPDQKIQSKRKTYAPCGICLKNFLPCTTQNVHILNRIFGDLYGISRVCTHFVEEFASQESWRDEKWLIRKRVFFRGRTIFWSNFRNMNVWRLAKKWNYHKGNFRIIVQKQNAFPEAFDSVSTELLD